MYTVLLKETWLIVCIIWLLVMLIELEQSIYSQLNYYNDYTYYILITILIVLCLSNGISSIWWRLN